MAKYERFYLTKWKEEGDTRICRLMQRGGMDDGTDGVMAEFTFYPAPLGKQLAEAALAVANAYEGSGSILLSPGALVELPPGTAVSWAGKGVDLPEAVTRVRETINEIEFMVRKGIPISNAPSLKHWLLRGLDALTGENHSGCATSLPQPKRALVEELAKDLPRPTWAVPHP